MSTAPRPFPGAGGECAGDPRRGLRLLDPFSHSTILASEIFKETSWGTVGVVMVGEQAAGTPTLGMAPARAGTLQEKEKREWARENSWGQGICRERVGQREVKCCPQGSHRQPFLVTLGRGSRAHSTGWFRNHGGISPGEVAACSVELILTCSFSS